MLTAEERVASLHLRMESLRRRRERRKTRALGASCAGLTLCLLLLIFGEGAAHPGGAAGMYSGAMMLFENAGGYVLTAVVAFAVGTLVTILCIKHRRAGEDRSRDPEEKSKNEGEKR